ncbi:Stp1/IreP family PP2C-type Ser/Thr phosphatase [Amphibacillus sp. MSJ-3]|uniref:Stp1/IreP family PP2C-type Ser/Thr phosphatase n=1 Tax=Amphibacillus sp. MSJ-3 TaxID=2841505 RepID=UPI001C0EC73B|nr:Stp1/IreP family PP2C-type Ser/Thr phosphatase [Amphibacillus sp. MSJ-3]MBU5594606.1 Stp1/IreP family PP2C-type Ser/Thr phosphatase [Amphibacillus sp. MSJ-3]
MKQYFLTDQGKVREQNEDAGGLFKNKARQTLSVIADGMGGHKAGDIASKIVRNFFLDQWRENEKITTIEQAEEWLVNRMHLANQKVYQYAEKNADCKGMGTTVIATIFLDDQITIAHIGDSRCYLLNQHLEQITEDHSLVNALVRTGEISKKEADVHPRKNVLIKALGTDESIDPDVFTIKWGLGDRLLICTDGLSDKVSDLELKERLAKNKPLQEIAEDLVNRANELGGEDNITLALLEYSTSEEGDSSC